MNTYSKKRKAMEPMSIEKNVKLNPRNAKKTKDPDWEYGTPKDIQSLQVYMRLLKERAEAAKLPVGFMNMEIVKDVIEHETMLELHKLSGGTTGDFKSGYELGMEENFYNPLWTLFGKQMVKHIKEFIKRIHYTTVFSLSQDLDQNEYREDYAIDYALEDSQGRKHSNIAKMTDDEKMTRRWIVDNNIHNKPYKLTEHRTCPQQNVSSFDCDPFVLHYMEAMCAGLDPNQEGGNQMRKKMLEEFAKLNK
ncbi:hypothetical protein ACLB2K_011005 [Fragaria x ananassa]